MNCRAIHAQLQQRQRLRALESFRSTPQGVLVATDVAARGLDIPKIQTVIHYDVARSPQVPIFSAHFNKYPTYINRKNTYIYIFFFFLQVYIHRSGRTARAGESGIALSIVSPEDTPHHLNVCAVLGVKTMDLLREDTNVFGILRQRVKVAKNVSVTKSFLFPSNSLYAPVSLFLLLSSQVFTQSFVLSQRSKEHNWLEMTSKESELAMDDRLIEEVSSNLLII